MITLVEVTKKGLGDSWLVKRDGWWCVSFSFVMVIKILCLVSMH